MQCDICGKKKATVHLTEIVDEQMSEMHLCEECARQKSVQMEQQFGLADLLAGLSQAAPTTKETKEGALKCAGCGLNYEDFRKFGRLGCSQCYVSFSEHLAGLLRKIHGSNRHLGKAPYAFKAQVPAAVGTSAALLPSDNLEDLKKQLHGAIAAEDFEKAATLRDKIRALENS
ncbi:MAG: UvrB/UvrC motif-containing protein [Candidatus Omnitrophica bacterium]|nr:UvrB/UvrC motif-containing protein [Candidatus Omnitrophota bacterium]